MTAVIERHPISARGELPERFKRMSEVAEEFLRAHLSDFKKIRQLGSIVMEDVLGLVMDFRDNYLSDWNEARKKAGLGPCSLKSNDDLWTIIRKMRIGLGRIFPNDHQSILRQLISPAGLPLSSVFPLIANDERLASLASDLTTSTSGQIDETVAEVTIALAILSIGSSGATVDDISLGSDGDWHQYVRSASDYDSAMRAAKERAPYTGIPPAIGVMDILGREGKTTRVEKWRYKS